VLLIQACSSGAPSSEPTARTEYEGLDLSSPEAAVTTFSSEFQARNFPAVFDILSPSAQMLWEQDFTILNWRHLIMIGPGQSARDILGDTMMFDLSRAEHSFGNVRYAFDTFMVAASEHSAFLIDLTSPLTIISTSRLPETPSPSGDMLPASLVTASVGHLEGDVRFKLVQVASGRWKVQQVITQGGNEELMPWSVP
jgi:hypothetical protein